MTLLAVSVSRSLKAVEPEMALVPPSLNVNLAELGMKSGFSVHF